MSIKVSNLEKYYGEQAAVHKVSFEVKRGEILGFLGPNGAGKSTTMKIITGFIPASSGNVEVCGMNVVDHPLKTREKIGYLPENNPLYLDMYVKEYLAFVAKIYKIKNPKERIAEMIRKVGLEKEQNKRIEQLSKGYRQRVGLAQAIIHDPEVLILDEPTSGLDPNQLEDIRNLIKEIGKEKTVMLSTHIMQEVEAICDRVVIIKNGSIVADDTASVLQNEGQNQVVYAEFDGAISKNALSNIDGVSKVKKIGENSFIFESKGTDNLKKIIARHAQSNNLLILTLREETRSLEEAFKDLTK